MDNDRHGQHVGLAVVSRIGSKDETIGEGVNRNCHEAENQCDIMYLTRQ